MNKFAFRRIALPFLTAALLAGCGDGGSPAPTPTPSPTPSPRPSPSPTPTSTPTPLAVLPTPVAASGDSSAGVQQADPAPGTSFRTSCRPDAVYSNAFSVPLARIGSGGTPALTAPVVTDRLRYAQNTGRYTFVEYQAAGGIDMSMSFGPENIDTAATTPEQTVFLRNQCPTTAGSDVYSLRLFNPGAANPMFKLSYASFGLYSVRIASVAGPTDYYVPFGYTLPTGTTGLNRSGSSTYSGVVKGKGGDQNGSYDVTGTVTTTVDFTTKSFTTRLDLTLKTFAGATTTVPTITFGQSGLASLSPLAANSPNGNLTGVLAGPQAEELAIAATLTVQNVQSPGVETRIALSGAAKR